MPNSRYNKVRRLVSQGKLGEANELKKQMVFTMPMARPAGMNAKFNELKLMRNNSALVWNKVVLLDYDSHSEQKSKELLKAITKTRTVNGATYSLMMLLNVIEIKYSIRGGLHILVPSFRGLTLKGSIAFYEYLFNLAMEEDEYAELVTDGGFLFDPAINTHLKLCLEAPTEARVFVNPKLYGAWEVEPEDGNAYNPVMKQFCSDRWQEGAYFQNPVAVASYFRKEVKIEKKVEKSVNSAPAEELKESVKRTIDEVIVPQRIDITRSELAWFHLGNALYNVLGETEGRQYFHKLSRFYPGYSYAECDSKFSRIAKNGGYHYTYETFAYFCKMYDVEIINIDKYGTDNDENSL